MCRGCLKPATESGGIRKQSLAPEQRGACATRAGGDYDGAMPAANNDQFPRLPMRPSESHKGVFGTLCVVGGCDEAGARMIGAPALVALAALRSGAGLVKLVMPATILNSGLALCPSATGVPLDMRRVVPDSLVESDDDEVRHRWIEPHKATATIDRVVSLCDVLALGPGLGTSPGARAATLRACQQESVPLVLDADGINGLAETPEFMLDLHAAAILTPHPGEFKRLCKGLGFSNDLGLARSREDACTQLAQRVGRIVVLKGAATVVSDGLRTWTCPADVGHPCLATAGTGDVLTGIIAGLVAQFCPSVAEMTARARAPAMPVRMDRPLDLYDAARVGVYVHARAGRLWAERRKASAGLLASELCELVPEVIESVRTQR